jgi:hypothetical protein
MSCEGWSLAAGDLALSTQAGFTQAARKTALDQTPARGKVRVVDRQVADGVQVFRQDAARYRFEGISLLNGTVDSTKTVDVAHQEIA